MAKENPANFDLLYQKYADKVYNFFYYRVGKKREVAEDLRQETFIRALKSLQEYHMNGRSYLTYLLTVAHNILVNYYRYTSMHTHLSLEDVDETADSTTNVASETEKKLKRESIWEFIESLPQIDKNVFFMRYERQLHIKEIAHAVQKTENAVKLILLRIKKKLLQHPLFTHHKESNEDKK